MSEEGPIKLAAAYTGVPRDILHLDIAGVIVLDKAQGLMQIFLCTINRGGVPRPFHQMAQEEI